ncbi:hypothetical protein EVAR_24203_1 [Eumeta japonica]|uniref:Uncharacterized protein n=1 Tax=Eumeta variegata TaxID=151549 RepID=A0A4C1W536_EUMVA|nr:hypothetical protein EVAR_24203_1 [Eumeta japonica]
MQKGHTLSGSFTSEHYNWVLSGGKKAQETRGPRESCLRLKHTHKSYGLGKKLKISAKEKVSNKDIHSHLSFFTIILGDVLRTLEELRIKEEKAPLAKSNVETKRLRMNHTNFQKQRLKALHQSIKRRTEDKWKKLALSNYIY